MFAAFAVFIVPTTAVYWHYSQDPTGTTALIMTFGLCSMIGFYLLFTAKRIDVRPEDDSNAEIADNSGELGFFSPYSWWPLAVAGCAAVIFLGIAVGWWLVALGVPFFAVAVYGFVFEYYRGEHAH
jgi:hypothetical protein